MDSKQSARSAMTTHPEVIESFIENARSAGLSEDTIESLLDMDLEELRAKSRELQQSKDSSGIQSDSAQ